MPQSPNEIAATAQGRHALVVDDEESILALVSSVLTADGCSVDTAQDGDAALEHIARKRYDVVVSDWKMKGLSGVQLYERLKHSNNEAARRMIFMTGDAINEGFQQFLRQEGKACLPKPFSMQDFRAAVADFLSPR